MQYRQRFKKFARSSNPGVLAQNLRRLTRHGTVPLPPQRVIVEPVEGCQQACEGCGIASIVHSATRRYSDRYMLMEVAEQISRNIRDSDWFMTTITISGRGEPTYHPRLESIIGHFREKLRTHPITLETTLTGYGPAEWLPGKIGNLFAYGLDVILVNCDESTGVLKRIHDCYEEICAVVGCEIVGYPEDVIRLRHRRDPEKPDWRLVLMSEPSVRSMASQYDGLHNAGGHGAPPVRTWTNIPCHRPSREMFLRYDGRAVLCSQDWRGEIDAGSVMNKTVRELWNGEVLDAARRHISINRRSIAICSGCSSFTSAHERLPHPSGLVDLEPPTEETARILVEAQARPPLTRTRALPWES